MKTDINYDYVYEMSLLARASYITTAVLTDSQRDIKNENYINIVDNYLTKPNLASSNTEFTVS